MSQVVHDKYAQMVKVDDVDLIPAAIVAAQTRDGKDELIVGAGAMVLDSGSGMWLPVSAANRLPVEATLTGSNLSDQDAIPVRSVDKAKADYDARIEQIVDLVGPSDLSLFLTWRDGDNVFRDLLRKDISFAPIFLGNRFTNYEGGPLGYYLENQGGLTDYLLQTPQFARAVDNPQDPPYAPKYATRFTGVELDGMLGQCAIRIRRKGTISSAKFKVSVWTDNNGQPGVPLQSFDRLYLNGRDADEPTFAGSKLADEYRWIYFSLSSRFATQANVNYWLVLEYVDDTGVDSSNFVEWRYGDSAGNKRAVFDGDSWTVVDNEAFEFRLYTPDLVLEDDFTVAALVQRPAPQGEAMLLEMWNENAQSFSLNESNGAFQAIYRADSGVGFTYRQMGMGDWTCVTVTYSRFDPLEKLSVYQNGRLADLASGTGTQRNHRPRLHGPGAGEPIQRVAKYVIGGKETEAGTFWGASWGGKIGPMLIVKRKLSDVEISKLASLMLGGGPGV